MLNIKKQKNGLNLQTDTNGLHKAYIPIINKVWLSDTNSPSPLSVCFDPHYWAYIVAGVRCLSYTSAFFLSVYIPKVLYSFLGTLVCIFLYMILVRFDYFLLLFLLDFRYVNSFTRRSFCVLFFFEVFSSYQLEFCQDFQYIWRFNRTKIMSNSTSRLTRTWMVWICEHLR